MSEPQLEAFRLSPQQEEAFRQPPASGAGYVAVCCAAFAAPPDEAAVERALAAVVARHEILRTTFRKLPGATLPVQVIESEGRVRLERAGEGQALDAMLARWPEEPFDLERGPVLRVLLGRLRDGRHGLLLALPSACADAVTLRNVLTELSTVLRSGGGVDRAAAEPSVQYADLAQWLHDLLEGESAAAGTEAWRASRLRDVPAYRSPEVRGGAADALYEARELREELDRGTLDALEELASSLSLRSGDVLLAAWASHLARRADQDDMLLACGTPLRQYPDLPAVVGALHAFLPRQVRVPADVSFADLARRVAQDSRDIAEREEYFSFRVLGFSDDERRGALAVAFDEVTIDDGPGAPRATLTVAGLRVVEARHALLLLVERSSGGTSLVLRFDGQALSEATARRILDGTVTLLRSGLASPTSAVHDLDMLPARERALLLASAGPERRQPPPSASVHALFESVAQRSPESVALIGQDARVTYADLARRARALAQHLRAAGVRDGQPVVLCAERSVELVVAILGILEAGGAYVPLDPDLPAARMAVLMADTRAAVVVTQRALAPRLPAFTGQVVLLEDTPAIGGAASTPGSGGSAPLPELRHDEIPGGASPAYVLYTSGSTGRPKGVVVSHASLVASTTARFEVYDSVPVGRFLLLSPFFFDSSVAGIFWTLCGGGALVLLAEGQQRDLAAIAAAVERHEVTHVLGLPSLYKALLDTAPAGRLQGLRCVVVAGEACGDDVVARHRAVLPGTKLYNEYGPTEATVWSTVLDTADHVLGSPVSIGSAIPGMRAHVLDARRRLVPIGVPGELWLEGPGLATGYLGDEALTAQRFAEVPGVGKRLYSTGDRVRRRDDGKLEFLGRTDQQVKVGGHRIELAEVEAHLLAAPEVEDACVVVRGEGDAARLVAFACLRSLPAGEAGPRDAAGAVAALRGRLAAELPAWMVPKVIGILDELPRLPSGKVDRAKLPEDASATRARSARHAPPSTPLERALAVVWSELLSVKDPGADESFFELGGHSILTLRLATRLSETFGVRLSFQRFFERPTIAALATSLSADEAERARLERISQVVLQVAAMSDDEVDAAQRRRE